MLQFFSYEKLPTWKWCNNNVHIIKKLFIICLDNKEEPCNKITIFVDFWTSLLDWKYG